MGDADYILAFQKIVMPIALEFSPDLVISSSMHCRIQPQPLISLHSLCRIRRGRRRRPW